MLSVYGMVGRVKRLRRSEFVGYFRIKWGFKFETSITKKLFGHTDGRKRICFARYS